MEKESMGNMHFPIYKKIEKEVLELSSAVCFTDDHIAVYSLYIADLIIRCSIELESIAKDIYRRETGKEPEKPGNCFRWMENEWNISKKCILIVSPYFHFKNSFQTMFCPFKYESGTSDDYYHVYNAIKHDKVKNIHEAQIGTLIRILAALYILNLYYGGNNSDLGNDVFGTQIVKTGGSDIFEYLIAPCPDNVMLDEQKGINPDWCIYKIVRKESYYAFNITYRDLWDEVQSMNMVQISDDFQQHAQKCAGLSILDGEFFDYFSKVYNTSKENFKEIIYSKNQIKEIISIRATKMKSSYWAILNKQ